MLVGTNSIGTLSYQNAIGCILFFTKKYKIKQ